MAHSKHRIFQKKAFVLATKFKNKQKDIKCKNMQKLKITNPKS